MAGKKGMRHNPNVIRSKAQQEADAAKLAAVNEQRRLVAEASYAFERAAASEKAEREATYRRRGRHVTMSEGRRSSP